MDSAIRDVVARGDVGPSYARATRRYGDQSEAWRLASVLFPAVSAQLAAHGADAARMSAQALAEDACARLHGAGKKPDLSGAQPITVPEAASSPAQPAPAGSAPTARSCYVLEEGPRPFPGHWLTLSNRGQYPDEAKMVQSQLNWWGYGCMPEDGDYGPVTEAAVRRFQRDFGLVVDGQVGPQTWNALFGIE